jgi:hypothetical protein
VRYRTELRKLRAYDPQVAACRTQLVAARLPGAADPTIESRATNIARGPPSIFPMHASISAERRERDGRPAGD